MSVQASKPIDAKRRVAVKKPAGRKTVSRFTKYAGGADSQALETAADSADGGGGGITAALVDIAAADGQTVVQIPVHKISSHPFNDPERSKPHPGDPKWDELVNGVKASGIKVPALLVTKKAFLVARPTLEASVAEEAEFVLIYGDRRRTAAAAAGLETMPAVVDDSVLVEGGDLDAMTLENLGRKDLSEIAEAILFARYSDLGMGQRAIADKLGVDQATVSRRLALLLLAPEVQQAITDGQVTSTEGVALASALPFGAARRWQKAPDADQSSADRHAEQLAALNLITQQNMIPSRAVDRVVAERQARLQAAAEAVEIVGDLREALGEQYQDRRIFEPDQISAAAANKAVVAAIDPDRGTLAYYSTEPAGDDGDESFEDQEPPTVEQNDGPARTAAAKARRIAARSLVASVPTLGVALPIFAEQYTLGIAATATSPQGWRLAQTLLEDTATAPSEFRRIAAECTDSKQRTQYAWACAIAGYELMAADKSRTQWGSSDVTYLDLLVSRAGYEPTTWEQQRLDHARRRYGK